MANVPIYFDQGGKKLTIGAGATLDTTNGTVTLGPVAIGPDGVATVNIQDDAVTTPKIDDQAITFGKTLAFISTEQTGTSMQQSIPHGLGVIPSAVIVVPSDTTQAMDGQFVITQGMHTNTNILVTVTTDVKYYVMAWG